MQLDAKALADVTAEIVTRHVAAATAPLLKRIETLEALPRPERGEKGETGEAGPSGRDGVGLAGALIDRSGVLVLTLADGTTRELGVVVGKDGETGPAGEAGPQGERGEPGAEGPAGERGSDGMPGEKGLDGATGRDGLNGKDGRDGFDLTAFDVEQSDDGRTVTLKFARGDVEHRHELKFPVVIDRGVFKDGSAYEAGDGCTWGGSFWIAQRETSAKPDSPDSGWRLSIKKGRDGKDAKPA
jgi:hypothetical protein